MSQKSSTVRLTIDIRTYDEEDLLKILKAQKDGLGDHIVSVVLPSYGFDGKAQAGGTLVHPHEPDDRACVSLSRSDRIWRDDGQDEI